jgi:predicted Zn-dependent protease
MRHPVLLTASLAMLAGTAPAQPQKDGSIADPAILSYVQSLADRVARASARKPVRIQINRSQDFYASLLPNGELSISSALLERIESEAELAGLLAHQLAHQAHTPACVLASPLRGTDNRREPERAATESAVRTLRLAGYEPSAVLDLFSKLAYEHPNWAKAIVPDDILDLRVIIESDPPPERGYIVDTSAFAEQHKKLTSSIGVHRRLSAANIF